MFETICLDAAAFLGALHVIGPAVARYTMRFAAHCIPNPAGMDELPHEVATLFGSRIPELANIGFEPVGCYDCGGLTNETHSYVAYFCNRATNDFANVCVMVTPQKMASYLELSTSFTNGLTLETNTNGALPLTPQDPSHRVFRFPKITKAQELYRIHRRLIEKYAAGLWPQAEPSGEELRRYIRVIENYGPRHARIGYMQLTDGGKWYRLTWKGATLMTWRGLWPTPSFRKWWQRQAMQAELDSLETRGITALQKA
ncbi:MAG TPA: hypothetical protein VJX72_00400 [Candidatus Acidoferrum sp.]|nr:hypothetical protein [Candidatus Acidoferrum sp.]